MNNYYEQPDWQAVALATYSEGNRHAEVLQLDEDGEYFCANVYTVDDEGYENFLNNSGSVNSLNEAIYYFTLDLDCFFNGKNFHPSLFTEEYTRLHGDK